jgi:NitT/TauT family transport system permease protein
VTNTIAPPDGQVDVVRFATIQRRWRTGAVVFGWLLFLGLWDVLTRLVGEVRLPSPRTVGGVMWDIISSGLFVEHFLASIGKVAFGFVLSVCFGAPIGFLMGRRAYWKAFFKDTVMVAGSIPGLTYAVMMLVIFGISLIGPVLAVALISMPYIAINVAEGLEGVDRRLLQMSQAYGRKPRDVTRHVLVPAILPFVFAGVRLSFAISWKVEQLTEVFGSNRGVGFQIRSAFQSFSVPRVLAWVLLFIAFMLVLERVILVRLERRLFRWRIEGED